MGNRDRYEAISVTVTTITGKAILINDGTKDCWIPKSLIEDPDDLVHGEVTEINVQEWFLQKEGLI